MMIVMMMSILRNNHYYNYYYNYYTTLSSIVVATNCRTTSSKTNIVTTLINNNNNYNNNSNEMNHNPLLFTSTLSMNDSKIHTVTTKASNTNTTTCVPVTTGTATAATINSTTTTTIMRLNKYLVQRGIAKSRRDADMYIKNKWITIINNNNSNHDNNNSNNSDSTNTTIPPEQMLTMKVVVNGIDPHQPNHNSTCNDTNTTATTTTTTTTTTTNSSNNIDTNDSNNNNNHNVLIEPGMIHISSKQQQLIHDYEMKHRSTTVLLNKPLGIISGYFNNKEERDDYNYYTKQRQMQYMYQHKKTLPPQHYTPAVQLLTKENMYSNNSYINNNSNINTNDNIDDYELQSPEQQQQQDEGLLQQSNTNIQQYQQRTVMMKMIEPYRLNKMSVAGRLDINTTGLLVFTQDGKIAQEIIGPNSFIEKEYIVRIEQQLQVQLQSVNVIDNIFDDNNTAILYKIEQLRNGVYCCGDTLIAKSVELLQTTSSRNNNSKHERQQQQRNPQYVLRIILTQGKKHHIRRMIESVDNNNNNNNIQSYHSSSLLPKYKVISLKRVRIGSIVLGSLPIGTWRYLYPNEWKLP